MGNSHFEPRAKTRTHERRVLAQVSPRSMGGLSLFDAKGPVTAADVDQFRSEAPVVAATAEALRKAGFEVLREGDVTISVAGPPERFAQVFAARLSPQRETLMEGQELEFLTSESALQVPSAMSGMIEGVAIAHPAQYYAESPLPPLAQPEAGAYRYLRVPDEVGLVLNAERVHRLGGTGKGVKVAMVDTGFYPHAFYSWHGFSVRNTVLGPGATEPTKDDHGHGTGEAANVFATAPGATLIPVKDAGDPTGAFNAAVAQNPHVITNSWGYHIDSRTWPQLQAQNPNLYAYLKTLEAAVANAVAKGIVVCFSAGNGHLAFPGSHPNVISVGGVHVNYPFLSNDDFEASSYASSFDSVLYPGRSVPDVCGLVGRKTAAFTAPLIMLPVQPGCELDLGNTGSGEDGWGIFSGTSAACPQVAGVVALLLERKSTLTPIQVKQLLIKGATDVKKGTTANGDTAGPGADAATGAGLVNAKWSFINVAADVTADFLEAPQERQLEMVAGGRMPKDVRVFVDEMIETLRSR